MWDAVLVVRTSDRRDDGADHFLAYTTQEFFEKLLKLKEGFHAAHAAAGVEPFSVEFMASEGTWGTIAGFDADREGTWAVAAKTVKIHKPESVELESTLVTAHGVQFKACWKNDESGVYFETPDLPWDVIEKYAKAFKKFPEGVLPAAKIDYAENDARPGTWMDEHGDMREEGEDEDEEPNGDVVHDLCVYCDHFVEEHPGAGTEGGAYMHLCDEMHHNPDDDHDARPRGEEKPLREWRKARPDLFVRHKDGCIGPNSKYHVTRLATKPAWEGKEYVDERDEPVEDEDDAEPAGD